MGEQLTEYGMYTLAGWQQKETWQKGPVCRTQVLVSSGYLNSELPLGFQFYKGRENLDLFLSRN